MSEPKEGELFRRNYLRSPVKLADSSTARRRLSIAFHRLQIYGRDNFAGEVEAELGIRYPKQRVLRAGKYQFDHEAFWQEAAIPYVLSAITLWVRVSDNGADIIKEVRRILAEEDLRYRVDSKGGVHYLVDEPFAHTVESTVSGLGDSRFTAARHSLEEALKHLGPTKQSGKGLIRGVFEAVETTFLVVVGPAAGNRLNAQAVEKHLKPLLMARYQGVPDAADKVSRLLEGFNAWVKEAHPYRHGTGNGDEVHEAPLELAILSANTGMGFIRFLAGLGPKS